MWMKKNVTLVDMHAVYSRMYRIFASYPLRCQSGPNSVFVFGRIVLSERIRIVSPYMYSAASDVYRRLHSVSASCSRSDHLSMGDE